MPVEIRELVIRATVETQRAPETIASDGRDQDIEEIVAQCVEQVLEALKRERER
jgi:hypothetical protein